MSWREDVSLCLSCWNHTNTLSTHGCVMVLLLPHKQSVAQYGRQLAEGTLTR